MSQLRVGSWSWSWQGMPRAGSRGWQSRAVPVCHRPAPLATRAAFPRVSVPSLPMWARVGVWDRQTDRKLPAPKGQAQLEPGPCLESGHQPGASSEQPLRAAARVVCAGVGGGSVALEPWLIGVRVSGKWPRSRLAPMAFFSLEKQPCPGCAVQGEEQGWGSGGVAHGWVWQLGPVP